MKRLMAMVAAMSIIMAIPVTASAQVTDEATDRPPVDARVTDQVTDRVERDFETARERALAAIDRRLEAIDRAQDVVATNPHLAQNHAAQLGAELDKHERELIDLREDIAAATTGAELFELVPLIVTEHWIFAMVIPKVALVVGADTAVDAVERGEELAERIQAAITRLEEAGIDMSAAQAELDVALAELATAEDLAEGVPGAVLSIKPSEMPGAKTAIQAARDDLRAAVDALRSAADHGRAAVELIRMAIDQP